MHVAHLFKLLPLKLAFKFKNKLEIKKGNFYFIKIVIIRK
jgi:hypothetical protein